MLSGSPDFWKMGIRDSLVAVEHRPGLCVLHHSPHELGRAGKGLLRVPQLPGQGMKTIYRRLGAGRKSLVIGEPMLPEILKRGGHLFEVIDLRPPRIGRALALGQPLLDVCLLYTSRCV